MMKKDERIERLRAILQAHVHDEVTLAEGVRVLDVLWDCLAVPGEGRECMLMGQAYLTVNPQGDSDELAKGRRAMFKHTPHGELEAFWAEPGELQAGWVIGVGV